MKRMPIDFTPDALRYAVRGWSIIPIRHGETADTHKRPALTSWKQYQTTPPSESEIREWFAKRNLDGLAIILGPVSGDTCCRDFDRAESYHEWAASCPELARTLPTVQTARGFHVYFRSTGCSPITLSDGELRAHGQYVLLPPSRHPTGRAYEWIVPLPDGELPTVDPVAVGLAPSKRDNRGGQGETGTTGVAPAGPAVTAPPALPVSLPADIRSQIEAMVPTGRGQHDDCNMRLARLLKLTFGISIEDARLHFRHWFSLARAHTSEQDEDSAWFKFRRAWEVAMIPLGARPADEAFAIARSNPIPTSISSRYSNPKIRLLLAAMSILTKNSGGTPFALSCHQVARFLEVTPKTAHEWLRGLSADGVTRCVARGKPGYAGRNAGRYVCLIPDKEETA